MDVVEKVIDSLLDAARPRKEHPPGELDRKRAQFVDSWQRLNTAGMLKETELQSLIKQFDRGLDYQRDHPMSEIDEILDSAIALARRLDADDRLTVSELADASVRRRLVTYAVRCASRALAQNSVGLCSAGLLARVLAIDPKLGSEDSRDWMVSLAPLHVAAQASKHGSAALFEQHAELAPAPVSETLKIFGRRTDVSLEAFGWCLTLNQPIQWIILAD